MGSCYFEYETRSLTESPNPGTQPTHKRSKYRYQGQVVRNSFQKFHGFVLKHPLIIVFSLITQVILEILLISLVEDCVICCYNNNHLVQTK